MAFEIFIGFICVWINEWVDVNERLYWLCGCRQRGTWFWDSGHTEPSHSISYQLLRGCPPDDPADLHPHWIYIGVADNTAFFFLNQRGCYWWYWCRFLLIDSFGRRVTVFDSDMIVTMQTSYLVFVWVRKWVMLCSQVRMKGLSHMYRLW